MLQMMARVMGQIADFDGSDHHARVERCRCRRIAQSCAPAVLATGRAADRLAL